jgi:hypothetical protein
LDCPHLFILITVMLDLSLKLNDLSLSSAEPLSDDPAKSNETDRLAFYDPAHPERQVANLIWHLMGDCPRITRSCAQSKGFPPDETGLLKYKKERHELCWVCGWTERHQIFSSYCPRVKIFHTRHNMGLWDIAGQWVLRDQPNDASKGNDLMTQMFLHAQPATRSHWYHECSS